MRSKVFCESKILRLALRYVGEMKYVKDEQFLFHGAKDLDKMDLILTQGFDFRLAGSSTGTLYGCGTYFARDASYSHDYAPNDHKKHERQLIVSRVLVGTKGRGTPDLKRPPPKSDGSDDLCDSAVDRVIDPSIFVVFDNSHSYPAYVITYGY